MAYTITPEDLASVTDLEYAFGTVRLLPKWEDIPEDFRKGNVYTRLAEMLFMGDDLPEYEIVIKPDFTPEALNKATFAHLTSFEPKHEHKIAGVGYLIAQVAILFSPGDSTQRT